MALFERARAETIPGVAATGSGSVLQCAGLRKRFGELEAVRGVSFRIAGGETYGLLGPNGAGKTTTISMLCGLLEPDAGEVSVVGRPLTTRSVAAKAAIGYVPQELAIYPDLSARENQLLLFIFLTSLTAAAFVIETRRLGIARRILSTPPSAGTLVAGQLLGRLAVALVQALIIVLGSIVFFGVSWGDPLGTAAVVFSFCLVGTGAAVLVGTLCSTERQAQPIAFLLGLGLAALGGSMAPLEVFPGTARTIAHITPHAWANDAFSSCSPSPSRRS